MTSPRLLIVEDEPAIAELLAINLRHAGFDVVLCADAIRAQEETDRALPVLAIVDWMLPGMSGLALSRQWRSRERTRDLPVIMLTAKHEEADKVAGLEAGADDYLTKPFSVKELLARVKAVLRRRAPHAVEEVVRVGELELNAATHRVAVLRDGESRELKLGPTEFRLLNYMMNHADRVHTRSQLLDRVWGDHVYIEERTVDVHIKRLREALAMGDCAHLIETVRGVGYRMAKPGLGTDAAEPVRH